MKNLSLPQQKPIRALKKWRGPVWSCRSMPLPFSFSLLWACGFVITASLNQCLFPWTICWLIKGDYYSRFWSVSLWCFSTVTVHSVFVIYPPKELFGVQSLCGLLNKGFMGTKSACELGHLPGWEAKGQTRTWETDTKTIHGTARQNEARHQIKPLPFKRSVIYTRRLIFKVLQHGKQTVRHLGGRETLEKSVHRQSYCNSKACVVREDRWLLGKRCDRQRENTENKVLISGVPWRHWTLNWNTWQSLCLFAYSLSQALSPFFPTLKQPPESEMQGFS